MAEMLNVPFVAYVGQIEEIANNQIRVRRLIDEGHDVIQSPLPLVISVTKEINVPRLPSIRGLLKSKNAKIPTWTVQDLGIDPHKVGLAGSSTQVIKIFTPQRDKKAEMLQGEPDVQVSCLMKKLREMRVIYG